MVEDDALTRISDSVFAFPGSSMYVGERLTFRGPRRGPAERVIAGAVAFPRREIGPANGGPLPLEPGPPAPPPPPGRARPRGGPRPPGGRARPAAVRPAEGGAGPPPAESGSFRAAD